METDKAGDIVTDDLVVFDDRDLSFSAPKSTKGDFLFSGVNVVCIVCGNVLNFLLQ